ncbi:MAG: hypothetical protein V1891_02300, partial [bacterium]
YNTAKTEAAKLANNEDNIDRPSCISDNSGVCCFSPGSKECSDRGASDGAGCCLVKPRIRIKDSWGWCSNGVANDICPVDPKTYQSFNGWVVVEDR